MLAKEIEYLITHHSPLLKREGEIISGGDVGFF